MKSLFDQTSLAGMRLKNRFVRSATYDGFADKSADVDLDGGSLHIDWAGSSKDNVYMTGPAVKVFEGDISL